MNFLELLIVLLIMFASFGIFIGVISEQINFLEIKTEKINSKLMAFECVFLAEGMFANGASYTEENFACNYKKGKIFYGKEGEETFIIAEKKDGLRIKIPKHYGG
jgi:hypothetical protein